jgi:methyl-accepting chemotaxis protein
MEPHIVDYEKIGMLTEIVQQIAGGNFTARAPVSETGDEFDALSLGVNMLAEELSKREAEIKSRVSELERYNAIFTDRELRMVELKKEIEFLKGEVAELKSKLNK